CRLLNASGDVCSVFELGEHARLEIYGRSKVALDEVVAGLEVANRHKQLAYGAISIHLGAASVSVAAGRLYRYTFAFEVRLGPADYLIDAAIGYGDRGDGAFEQVGHRVSRIAGMTVKHPGTRPRFFGAADLSSSVE